MRIRRSKLVDRRRPQVFHVVSRVVDRRKIFEKRERTFFLRLLRRLEAFTGVRVLTYCLMGNHFHLLILAPRCAKIPWVELQRRIRAFYPPNTAERMIARVEEGRARGDCGELNRLQDRMGNLSTFVKELKEGFSRWYNRLSGRVGTLWEGRFRSVLVETSDRALFAVASYIDLNAVRAGLAASPRGFLFCGYGEAKQGGGRALRGLRDLLSLGVTESSSMNDQEVLARYETGLYRSGPNEDAASVRYPTRLRGFTEGVLFGGARWIANLAGSLSLARPKMRLASEAIDTGDFPEY